MALLLERCDVPTAMLTLEEDCVSVVLPPSAADSPEITRPLEKLRFPKSRLSVDEEDDTWTTPQRKKGSFYRWEEPETRSTGCDGRSLRPTGCDGRSLIPGLLAVMGGAYHDTVWW